MAQEGHRWAETRPGDRALCAMDEREGARSSSVLRATIFGLALLGLAMGGCGQSVPTKLEAGDPAPAFSLKDLSGQRMSLEDYRGKLVLLNFWATYCDPCREEMPILMGLYDDYKAKGLVVVGISLDETGEAAVRPFVQALRIGYPILIGNSDIFTRYRGFGIPMTGLIDRDGKIVKKWVGSKSRAEFEAEVRARL